MVGPDRSCRMLTGQLEKIRLASGQKIRVGIPRAMTYYEYGRLWEEFFTLLGCQVVLSDKTNKTILESGVKSCSNETCLPVKVLHGHILDLMDKTDCIFIPRYVSSSKIDYFCPKLCALPDMARLNLKEKAKIIEVKIDLKDGTDDITKSLRHLASVLSIDAKEALGAYREAAKKQSLFAMEAAQIEPDSPKNADLPAVALLGHPYMLQDDYVSMGLAKKLTARGLRVLTPEDLSFAARRGDVYPYQGRIFYGVGLDNLGSANVYGAMPSLKGMIYLTPFACGIDSLVTEFIEIHLREQKNIPWMKLTVDEHTGEAGFDTRVEAFLDMIGV